MFIVYSGLAYLGAQGGNDYPADVDTTYLLTDLVRRLAGTGGSVVLSLAVIFACLTTAVGMIATTGQWVEDWTKGKVSYKLASLVITIIYHLFPQRDRFWKDPYSGRRRGKKKGH